MGDPAQPTRRRLPWLRPDELDDAQAQVYRSIADGPRSGGGRAFPLTDAHGRLHGPFDAMLRSAPVGGALQELGAALRYRSALSPRVREIATLAVAAYHDSAFERFAHEAISRRIGFSDEELAALAAGGALPGDDPVEEAALAATRALLAGDLGDDTFSAALAALGERGLFELTCLVGYYSTLALQLRVFRVGLPEES